MVQHPRRPHPRTNPNLQTLLVDGETGEFPDPLRAGFRHGALTPHAVGRVVVESGGVGGADSGRGAGVVGVGWGVRDLDRGLGDLGDSLEGVVGGWVGMGEGRGEGRG